MSMKEPNNCSHVKCLVKTRIPTQHYGTFHVYLYEAQQQVTTNNTAATAATSTTINNLNNISKTNDVHYEKYQHLAFVYGNEISSFSLNKTIPGETDRDRKIRGASTTTTTDLTPTNRNTSELNSVLCRIHSSCFTGETICSGRCDCSDQLYQAMNLIHQQGSGVILYLRQEGRGIGLLDKLKAYNLQDMGYDTVTANELLNHPPDARTYHIAASILHDLNIQSIKLLTNNPDKIKQMQLYDIDIIERIPMLPDHWIETSNLLPRIANKSHNCNNGDNDRSGHHDNSTILMPQLLRFGASQDFVFATDSYSSPSNYYSARQNAYTLTKPDDAHLLLSTMSNSRHSFSNTSSNNDPSETTSDTSVASSLENQTNYTLSQTSVTREIDRYIMTKIKRMNHMIQVPSHISKSLSCEEEEDIIITNMASVEATTTTNKN